MIFRILGFAVAWALALAFAHFYDPSLPALVGVSLLFGFLCVWVGGDMDRAL